MAAVLHADVCGGVTAPSDKPLSQRMTRHALAILHLLNAESVTVTAVASGSFTSDGTFSAKKRLMHKIQKLVLGIIHLLNEGPAQLDVSVSVTEEDLLFLETEQRALYRDLMTDNEQTLRSAGAFNVKTEAASRADKPERHMREPQAMQHNESVTDMIMSAYTNTTHRNNKPERQMREPQDTSVTNMIMSDYTDTTHRSNKPERHMREPQDTRHNGSVTNMIMSTYTDTTHRSNKPERQMREPQGTSVTDMIMSAYTDTTHRSNKPGASSSSFEDYPSTFSEDKKNNYSSTFLDPATKPLPQCSNNEPTINSYQLPSTNTCTENSPNTFEKVFTDSCKDSSFMSTYSSAFTETCPIIPTSTCQSTLLSSITDTYQNTCPDDLPVIQIKQEGSQMELNSWHWTVEDCVTSQNSSAGEAQLFGRKPGKSARKSPTCKTLTKENDEVLGPLTVSAESLHPEHRTKSLMSSENNRRCSSKTDSRPLHRKLSWKKPYECLRCDKSFKCRSHLVMHQRVHTRERPYVCTECGKSFTQSSNLFRHQRGHRGERPHACTECGKTFTHSSYLLIHIRTHTGEKPYSCRVCGSCFRVKSALVRHERVHMAEKR